MQPDLVMAYIITKELGIDPARVVVQNQRFTPPDDKDLYIVIATRAFPVVGSSIKFDSDTNEEVKSVSSIISIDIELTSYTREALEKKEEVYMALESTYGQQQMESNNMKMFRAGDAMDLSFIEGASSLNRWRIPIKVAYVKTKRTVIIPYEKFKIAEVAQDG